ncbi:MAG TPA: amino acid permease [Gemmatimonadales bacterium]|jgi:APA family basic amino acid/polyamine antiporter|nr:amino acid permease [Gemmatimonadales bacterium]
MSVLEVKDAPSSRPPTYGGGTGLWATKSISALRAEAEATGERSLNRTLGAMNLTMLGIGAIIGAGIFVLTGLAAALHAGPAVPISFIFAAVACGLAGLCYAEMASAVPVAGSAYTYSYATMGEFIAWIIGWDLVLEYAMGAATVGVGWSGYFVSLLDYLGIHIPVALTSSPLIHCSAADVTKAVKFCTHEGWNTTGALFNLPAVAIVLIASAILVIGIEESAKVNNIIVVLKIAVVLMFIAFGLGYVNTANWHPFIPQNTGTFGQFGWSGVFRGAGLIFFAYIGFDAVSTAAQEAKNPQRDMPIGILGSLAICTVLYILVSMVLTGVIKYDQLNVAHPVAYAVENVAGLRWLTPFITVGAVLGLGSVVLVMLLGQSRVFYSMSRDGLMGPWAGKVHPKYRTPYLSTIYVGLIVAVITGTFPIQLLGELVNIGTLLAFVLVCAGVWILRRTRPDLERPFRTPLVPFVPILGIISCFGLMATLPGDTWIRLFVWLLIGFVIYFSYGRKHSHLQQEIAAGGKPMG